MLSEKVACETVSPQPVHTHCRTCIQVQGYATPATPLRLRADSSNGVSHVMKITVDESNRKTDLVKQQAFCLSPGVLARGNKMSVKTMLTAADRGSLQVCAYRL